LEALTIRIEVTQVESLSKGPLILFYPVASGGNIHGSLMGFQSQGRD